MEDILQSLTAEYTQIDQNVYKVRHIQIYFQVLVASLTILPVTIRLNLPMWK